MQTLCLSLHLLKRKAQGRVFRRILWWNINRKKSRKSNFIIINSRGGVGLHPSGKYINMSIHIFRIQWLICPFQCGSLCDRLWFMWEPRRRGVPFQHPSSLQPLLHSLNCTLDPVTWDEISQNQNQITFQFQDSYCRLSTLSQLMLEFWNPLGNRGMMKADYSNSTCT